jgi:hypothetical protein
MAACSNIYSTILLAGSIVQLNNRINSIEAYLNQQKTNIYLVGDASINSTNTLTLTAPSGVFINSQSICNITYLPSSCDVSPQFVVPLSSAFRTQSLVNFTKNSNNSLVYSGPNQNLFFLITLSGSTQTTNNVVSITLLVNNTQQDFSSFNSSGFQTVPVTLTGMVELSVGDTIAIGISSTQTDILTINTASIQMMGMFNQISR